MQTNSAVRVLHSKYHCLLNTKIMKIIHNSYTSNTQGSQYKVCHGRPAGEGRRGSVWLLGRRHTHRHASLTGSVFLSGHTS